MKKNNHTPHTIVILTLIVILSGCALSGCSETEAAQYPMEKPEVTREKISYVKLQVLKAQNLEETFTLPGTLEAWVNLDLAAEMSGPVTSVIPEEGARIKKGDVILTIDDERLEAELNRDEVELALLKKKLERRTLLVERNLVSQQEFEDAKLAVEQTTANLKLAKVAFNKSTLKSPIDGILDKLDIDPGEYIREGTKVATMLQINRLKALVDVPEKDVAYLKIGQKAEVFIASIKDDYPTGVTGEIVNISYQADAATRTYRAKLLVDNADEKLRSGMIIKVRFLRRALKDVIAIPLSALVENNNSRVVFVANDGRAQMRNIEIGGIIKSQVIITSGLKPGDTLIVQGQHMLTDGALVMEGDL